MKKYFLICFLTIFCLPVFSIENQDIKLLGELTFYPERILKAIDFNDLYKIQQFSLSAPLFQNNIIRQKNNGFFGINFNEPVAIKFLSVNGSLIPDISIEFSIDNLDKIKMIIATFSQNSYSLTQSKNIYWLSGVSSSKPAFPMIIKNKRAFLLGDASRFNFVSSGKIDKNFDLTNISDTSPERAEQALKILNFISDPIKNKIFSAAGILPPEIPVTKPDVLGYIFSNITGDYLDKLYQQFNIEYIKQVFEENTSGKQISIVRKIPLNLLVDNYSFFNDNSEEKKKITIKSDFASKISDNVFMYYTGNGSNSQLKKLLNNKRIFPDNTEFSGVKDNIITLISSFAGEIYFFVTPNQMSGSTLTTDFFNKFNISLALEIADAATFENAISKLSNENQGKIKYQKEADNMQRLVLSSDTYSVNLYIGYADLNRKYVVFSSNKSEAEKYSSGAAADNQKNIISYLEKKINLSGAIDNSFYFINLKHLLKYIYDMEKERLDEVYRKVANYLIDCSDAIFGYTKYSAEYNNQSFTIKQLKAMNILEIYNIFQNTQNQQPGAGKNK